MESAWKSKSRLILLERLANASLKGISQQLYLDEHSQAISPRDVELPEEMAQNVLELFSIRLAGQALARRHDN